MYYDMMKYDHVLCFFPIFKDLPDDLEEIDARIAELQARADLTLVTDERVRVVVCDPNWFPRQGINVMIDIGLKS